MALPPELATVNLYGTYVNLDGTPTVGYLIFEPSPAILRASASREFVVPKTMQVNLDENGHFSIQLPAGDDPDITPVDWTYQVTEAFGVRRVYTVEIHVAGGPTQNIYDLAPVALANGTYYLQGDRGPAGPDILTTVGKPAATVGDDADKAIDMAAGVIYVRTGATWDNGTKMGTDQATGDTVVRRDVGGGAQFGAVGLATQTNAWDATRKDYVDTADALKVDKSSKNQANGYVGLDASSKATIAGDVTLGAQLFVGTNLTVAGAASLNSATVTTAPANPTDVANKTYVDGAVSASLSTKVQIGGDLGGTITAPTVTNGTHHTHTSSQLTDAASAATASVLVKRDAAGRFQAVDPSVAADVATKNYVDTNPNFQAVSGKNAASGYVGLDASSNATVAGILTSNHLTLAESAPSAPATGSVKLYTSATHRLTVLDATKSMTTAYYWGSGTAFPTTGVQTGDTFLHTNATTNSMWRYNGTKWVLADQIFLTTTTARDTWLAALPAGTAYSGLTVDIGHQIYVYNSATSAWIYAGGNAPTLTNVTWTNTAVWTDFDTTNFGRVKYGIDASGRVVLQGLIKMVAAAQPAFGSTLFTLPTGFRPATTQMVSAVNQSNQTSVRFDVLSTGAFNFQAGVATQNQFIDLTPVGFWPANN